MVAISEQKLDQLFKNFRERKVIVLGDLMLDRYIEGTVQRISPEAPVPVVEVANEFVRLGGAANVVYNIRSLGAVPVPVGVVGTDSAGEEIIRLLQSLNIETDSVIIDSSRPTVMKTRIIANNQHVVRADWESRESMTKQIEARVVEEIEKHLRHADALIIEDYNKGLLSKSLIENVIRLALRSNKIITVDPKFDNFLAYQNVTVFKPNRKEIEAALGMHIDSHENLEQACQLLSEKLNTAYILITLGELGAIVSSEELGIQMVPALRVPGGEVVDTTGAGDAWCGAFMATYASTGDVMKAVAVASIIASLKCQGWGPSRLLELRFRSPDEVIEYVMSMRDGFRQRKLTEFLGES